MRFRSSLVRLHALALWIPRFVCRHEALCVGLCVATLLAAAGYTASIRPLWYDELFTYHVASLPGLASIWDALREGADTHPPLSY